MDARRTGMVQNRLVLGPAQITLEACGGSFNCLSAGCGGCLPLCSAESRPGAHGTRAAGRRSRLLSPEGRRRAPPPRPSPPQGSLFAAPSTRCRADSAPDSGPRSRGLEARCPRRSQSRTRSRRSGARRTPPRGRAPRRGSAPRTRGATQRRRWGGGTARTAVSGTTRPTRSAAATARWAARRSRRTATSGRPW
ncbi:unnamed protein product, partial [Prorocentrum cordatum]